jgi:hypothetical protein
LDARVFLTILRFPQEGNARIVFLVHAPCNSLILCSHRLKTATERLLINSTLEQRLHLGCYTFSVVEYVRLGRKLGIGTRVAAKILRDRAQNRSSSPRNEPPRKPVQRSAPVGARAAKPVNPRAVRNVTRGVAQGSRGFGRAFWKPFANAVRALWHEITGVFFAIFALFFAQNAWRLRGAWSSGPEQEHFAIYMALTLVFVYFSITAFVSSRRSPH